jgi:Zinc finger, C3HC4 type (RING finger)
VSDCRATERSALHFKKKKNNNNKRKMSKFKDVQCRACSRILDDPRTLFCMHSYCRVCVESMMLDMDDKCTVVRCPLCSNETPLASPDANALPKDLDLVAALRRYRAQELSSKSSPLAQQDHVASSSSSSSSSLSNQIDVDDDLDFLFDDDEILRATEIDEREPSIVSRAQRRQKKPVAKTKSRDARESRAATSATVHEPVEKRRVIKLSDAAADNDVKAAKDARSGSASLVGSVLNIVSGDSAADRRGALLREKSAADGDDDRGALFASADLSPTRARGRFESWARGKWLAPSDFLVEMNVSEMERVFVPWWVFAAKTHTHYSALVQVAAEQSPADEADAADESGVARREWVEMCGERDATYDDIVLLATGDRRLQKWANAFSKRHWQWAKARSPIADMDAERLDALPKAAAWQSLWEPHVAKIKTIERKAAQLQLARHSNKVKQLKCRVTFVSFRRRLVYLPIYLLTYLYEEKFYIVSIHGITGRVLGARPYGFGMLGKVSSDLKQKVYSDV